MLTPFMNSFVTAPNTWFDASLIFKILLFPQSPPPRHFHAVGIVA